MEVFRKMNIYIFFFGGGGLNFCVDNVGGHRYFVGHSRSIKSKDSELE